MREQISAVAAASCRLGYHRLCSMRGANVYERAMSPPSRKCRSAGCVFRLSRAMADFVRDPCAIERAGRRQVAVRPFVPVTLCLECGAQRSIEPNVGGRLHRKSCPPNPAPSMRIGVTSPVVMPSNRCTGIGGPEAPTQRLGHSSQSHEVGLPQSPGRTLSGTCKGVQNLKG
jgi:hypothetical protein